MPLCVVPRCENQFKKCDPNISPCTQLRKRIGGDYISRFIIPTASSCNEGTWSNDNKTCRTVYTAEMLAATRHASINYQIQKTIRAWPSDWLWPNSCFDGCPCSSASVTPSWPAADVALFTHLAFHTPCYVLSRWTTDVLRHVTSQVKSFMTVVRTRVLSVHKPISSDKYTTEIQVGRPHPIRTILWMPRLLPLI